MALRLFQISQSEKMLKQTEDVETHQCVHEIWSQQLATSSDTSVLMSRARHWRSYCNYCSNCYYKLIVTMSIHSHRHCHLHLHQHHEYGIKFIVTTGRRTPWLSWLLQLTRLNQRLGDGDSFLRREATRWWCRWYFHSPFGMMALAIVPSCHSVSHPYFSKNINISRFTSLKSHLLNSWKSLNISEKPKKLPNDHHIPWPFLGPRRPRKRCPALPGFPSASLYTARPTCRCRSAPGRSAIRQPSCDNQWNYTGKVKKGFVQEYKQLGGQTTIFHRHMVVLWDKMG